MTVSPSFLTSERTRCDCGEILPKIIEDERKTSKELYLVLDPPRKGCDKKVILSILKSLPDKPGVYIMKNYLGEVIYVGK